MKKIFFSITLLSLLGASKAQTNAYLDNALTNYNNTINSGTARYIGMGGAMGAVGGDISAINQNPAGLGVFIKSNLIITPMINSSSNTTRFGAEASDNTTNFNFGQLGLALNIKLNDETSKWKSVAVGFNYTKEDLANSVQIASNDKINRNIEDSNKNIVATYSNAGHSEIENGLKQKINIAIGANYNHNFYIGTSFNFHHATFQKSINYFEIYHDSSSANNNKKYSYNQNDSPYQELGNGFSTSIGAIAKVDKSLRLGLAYHSPIWWTGIAQEYYYHNNIDYNTKKASSQYLGAYKYDLTTEGKLVASGAFVMGKTAVLSFDYTRHFNDDIKFRPAQDFTNTNTIKNQLIENNSEYRVGIEVRQDNWRLRGGYNYIQSPHKDFNTTTTDSNLVTSTGVISKYNIGDKYIYSAGLGYNFGNFYMDLAFQHQVQDYTYIFGNEDYIDPVDKYPVSVSKYKTNATNRMNNFLLTLGWKL